MKKYLFMAASAALVMSSCSSDELVQETPATDGQVAVAFDAPYLTSRASATDVLSNDGLKTRGFGVFAYDQDNKSFSAYYPTSLQPNFMYNQSVTFTSPEWKYSPVKYYNNNVGAKHSFFAYAPFAATEPGNGDHLNLNDPTASPALVLQGVNNGPAIHYVMPANLANAVDLCWGEYNNTGRAAIDLEKPGVEQKLNFTFHHALSRVSFNAQLWVDEVRPELPHGTGAGQEGTPTNGLIVDGKTTVTIKSLKLVGTMATEGTLRLYDGVWDAQVATSQSLEMADYFTGGTGTIVMPKKGDSNEKKEIPLFGESDTDLNDIYVMLLPGGSFQIEITYDVETADPNLPGGKSVVTNTITSDEIYSLNAGQTYQFHLNLGLTSVKFNADITGWETDKITEIDVPANHHEVVNAVPVGTTFTSITEADFLGQCNVAPAVDAAEKYYYNTTEKKLYKSQDESGIKWNANVAVGGYYAESNLYIVETAGNGAPASVQTAPRWVKAGANYYLYENGAYSDPALTVSDTSYSTLAALDTANPATGLYNVEGTIIYYVKRTTPPPTPSNRR